MIELERLQKEFIRISKEWTPDCIYNWIQENFTPKTK